MGRVIRDNSRVKNRPYWHEACELCGQDFWAWRKEARYCSNKCSVRDNPKPQNLPQYPITLELLGKADEESKGYESAMKLVSDWMDCDMATVYYAARRLGYKWKQRKARRGIFGPTTEVEQKYVRAIGCVVCEEKRAVDAAHIIPRRKGGSRLLSNILPLCPTHHRLYDRNLLSEEERSKVDAFIAAKKENTNGGKVDSESHRKDGKEGYSWEVREGYREENCLGEEGRRGRKETCDLRPKHEEDCSEVAA